jgi:hypothetical protein
MSVPFLSSFPSTGTSSPIASDSWSARTPGPAACALTDCLPGRRERRCRGAHADRLGGSTDGRQMPTKGMTAFVGAPKRRSHEPMFRTSRYINGGPRTTGALLTNHHVPCSLYCNDPNGIYRQTIEEWRLTSAIGSNPYSTLSRDDHEPRDQLSHAHVSTIHTDSSCRRRRRGLLYRRPGAVEPGKSHGRDWHGDVQPTATAPSSTGSNSTLAPARPRTSPRPRPPVRCSTAFSPTTPH